MRDVVLKVFVVLLGAFLTVGFIFALQAVTQAPEIDGSVPTVIVEANNDANPDAASPETDMELYLKNIPVKPPKLIKKPPALHQTDIRCEYGCDEPFITSLPSRKQIVYRAVPMMPENAVRSGHCTFDLDVGIDGRVSNLSNLRCSDRIFEQSSKQSAMKWVFKSKIIAGKPVSFLVKNQVIKYRLMDEDGHLIPEL